jgi:hypothetical protein
MIELPQIKSAFEYSLFCKVIFYLLMRFYRIVPVITKSDVELLFLFSNDITSIPGKPVRQPYAVVD